MNLGRLQFFDKQGYNINATKDALITIDVRSDNNNLSPAQIIGITDISGNLSECIVENYGYNYDMSNLSVKIIEPNLNKEHEIDWPNDAQVFPIDLNISDGQNPEGRITQGVFEVTIDTSLNFYYPSLLYTGALFLKPISVDLIETEELYILELENDQFIRPYAEGDQIYVRMVGYDEQIKLFITDETNEVINWSDELIYDISPYEPNIPLTINIGFKSEDEGVFERKLQIFHVHENEFYLIGEFVINAEAIGQDERFNTHITNFGLPDPKTFPHLFKEADIKEDKVDWELINEKSKHLILEYSNIIPYIGTYKGIINAIKWLGYTDIKIKEWFKNVKENKKLAYDVPYEAKDRSKTILNLKPDERRHLKKLNKLSLAYCITKETGEIDINGDPVITECWDYTIDEILVKLKALKDWLEKHIIGVNARIIEVTGEGIYLEKFNNIIYSTQDKGTRGDLSQSLTPITLEKDSELINGDSSINLTLKELHYNIIEDLENKSFEDMIYYYWNPYDETFTLKNDIEKIYWDSSLGTYTPTSNYLFIDPVYNKLFDFNQYMISYHSSNDTWTLNDPSALFCNSNYPGMYDCITPGITDKCDPNCHPLNDKFKFKPNEVTLVIIDNLPFKPNEKSSTKIYQWDEMQNIFVNVGNNKWLFDMDSIYYSPTFLNPLKDLYDLKWKDSIEKEFGVLTDKFVTNPLFIYENEIKFYNIFDSSSLFYNNHLQVTLEQANLRDASNDIWEDSLQYSIYKDPSGEFTYIFESSTGDKKYSFDFIGFLPDTNYNLEYSWDQDYDAPLLKIKNFYFYDNNGDKISLPLDKTFNLEIIDGKIKSEIYELDESMDTSLNLYKKETDFINFNYDTSLDEQKITLNIIYESPRYPVYHFDPSLYYFLGPDAAMTIDNSIYNFQVNHIGKHNIEVFGWDAYNNIYRNFIRKPYDVWVKYPEINIFSSDLTLNNYNHDITLQPEDVSNLVTENFEPIFERQVHLKGIELKYDNSLNEFYIEVPSISYFVDVPEPGNIARFLNLTEKVIERNGNYFTVNINYEKFLDDPRVNLILYNKKNQTIIAESDHNINQTNGNIFRIYGVDSSYAITDETELYIQNRQRYHIDKDYLGDTSIYIPTNKAYKQIFEPNQLMSIVIQDISNNKYWGSTYKVISKETSTNGDVMYYLDKPIYMPDEIKADPNYKATIQYANSKYVDLKIDIKDAIEEYDPFENYNSFKIYFNDTYHQKFYLDDTFTFTNLDFDHQQVMDEWFNYTEDTSLLDLINHKFYNYIDKISPDSDTLLLFDALYDSSNYMLNQKNIWNFYYNNDKKKLLTVLNKQVPYIFRDKGYYDIEVESYDSYGNLITNLKEGILEII